MKYNICIKNLLKYRKFKIKIPRRLKTNCNLKTGNNLSVSKYEKKKTCFIICTSKIYYPLIIMVYVSSADTTPRRIFK